MNSAHLPGNTRLAARLASPLAITRRLGLTLTLSLALGTALPGATAPVKVLILSGQNNHDWKQTTPKLKAILRSSGRFEVDVTEHPERCDASVFAGYQVILSDWNTFGNPAVTNWPEATRSAFLDFVRNGKGLVVVHAGSSSFYDWPEYQQLAGASWKLGQTSHGSPHEFTVRCVADHPITRGVQPFQTTDELWVRPGLDPGAQILATGDGQPVALCTEFGKGRGFTILMGHSAQFTDTPGFQTLLLRGTEWAATGTVTLAANVGERLVEDAVIEAVSKYRFGDDRKAVLRLEKLTAAAAQDPATGEALAAKLAAMLSAEATLEAKQVACRQLSLVGSSQEAAMLGQLLADTNLEYYARMALERIPDAAAEEMLLVALKSEGGAARRGIINSLAARQSAKAVPELANLLGDNDPITIALAIDALGRIGGAPAAAALSGADGKIPSSQRSRVADALLRCAAGMAASGKSQEAASILARLVASNQPAHIRMAAFPAWVKALGDHGRSALLSALDSGDEVLQAAALRALRASPELVSDGRAAEPLGKLPPRLQVQLLTLLGDAGASAAIPAIIGASSSANSEVKAAAIEALGRSGNASVIPVLAKLGSAANEQQQQLVVEALGRLRGTDVDREMVTLLKTAPSSQQRELMRAVVMRQNGDAVSTLIELASAEAGANRNEAIAAVGRLGKATDCAGLMSLLKVEPEATASAMAAICRRAGTVEPMLAGIAGGATAAGKASLVEALSSIGGSEALLAVQKEANSESPEVRMAAVRSLANWPDSASLDELIRLGVSSDDPRVKTLAVRGVARLAPLAKDRSPEKRLELLLTALKASAGVPEQKALLGAIAEIPGAASQQALQGYTNSPELGAEARAALERIQARGAPPSVPWTQTAADFFTSPQNLCRGCAATNLDGLTPDGQGQAAYAAVDGDPESYWDETDNRALYWIRVQLKQPSSVACLRILGWRHHDYAPRDFEIIGDGKLLKGVQNAQYENDLLTVDFPPRTVATVELKITGYYGQSPAIRELGLFAKPSNGK